MLQLRTWDTLGGGERDWLRAKYHPWKRHGE